MNVLFADSFYYLALLNPDDAAHAEAVELARSLRCRVVTTAFVIIEIADAMGSARQRGNVLALLENLGSDPNLNIVPPTQDLYEAGLDLYAQRPDKDWSLTDCISFSVMMRNDITDALTADRHFQQAGFNALLI